jgi:hypothetical protein
MKEKLDSPAKQILCNQTKRYTIINIVMTSYMILAQPGPTLVWNKKTMHECVIHKAVRNYG